MKKYIIASLFITCIWDCSLAQKGSVSLGLNAGTTITLTESSYYKPGLHLMGIIGYGVSSVKQDALTAHAGYHSFVNKRLKNDVVKMMDIKIGYRFFPSAKVPVYLHPNVGAGFFADGSGGKASAAAGIILGYLPKIGRGNINVFAAYNRINFTTGISLLNLGVGYQFNLTKQ